MPRRFGAGLAAVFVLAGCLGGGAQEDDGTLEPSALHRVADRATFRVRLPGQLGSAYPLVSVGQLTRGGGHYSVSFDVVGRDGPILSVEEAENSRVGVISAYTKGATALGRERVGSAVWRVYDQPSVGGLVYARRFEDRVEIVVHGDGNRVLVRALAASLA